MSNYSVIRYSKDKENDWDDFVEKSNNGTIYHKHKFLNYHKQKFIDTEHHLMVLKGTEIAGVFPLGIREEGEVKIAISPIGASWGGLVTKNISTSNVLKIFNEILEYLKNEKVSKIKIVTTPNYCYKIQNFNIEFAMINLGFKIINTELLHVVNLDSFNNDVLLNFDSKCRNQVRKGMQYFENYRINFDRSKLYEVLCENKKMLNSTTTHTFEELEYLTDNFKNEIFYESMHYEDKIAGSVIFKTTNFSYSTFYLFQHTDARGFNGLNALIYNSIKNAKEQGYKYYDFGTSSINSKIKNQGLVDFKESFGAIVNFRKTYELEM